MQYPVILDCVTADLDCIVMDEKKEATKIVRRNSHPTAVDK